MLFSLLQGGNIQDIIISLLLTLPIVLFALCIHETAHGWVAWKCGDSTAYNMGRLTLNPLKHLDPIGTVCMLLIGYGWANPVPVNTRNFRNPRKGMALTAAAGPGANMLIGLFSAIVAGILYGLQYKFFATSPSELVFNIYSWTYTFFLLGAQINFTYMIFNLIPLPPFDGSRIAYVFLPDRIYFGVMRYERQILMGVLIGMMILTNFTNFSFGSGARWLTNLICENVAKLIFSLVH